MASISLPKFVNEEGVFEYERLLEIVKIITINLNRVIDNNYYPVEAARYSNMRHRPIGMGVQGLADTFIKMKIAYDSKEAIEVNEKIFETIYFAGC